MRIIGIDPGGTGGLALLDSNGVVCATAKMPDTAADLVALVKSWMLTAANPACIRIYFEAVHSSPQQGVSSAFKFGRNNGLIEGVITALGLRFELVSPMKWQKAMGCLAKGRTLAGGDTEKKNANKAAAQRLFPGEKITHAIADALLIAEYGRRMEASQQIASA